MILCTVAWILYSIRVSRSRLTGVCACLLVVTFVRNVRLELAYLRPTPFAHTVRTLLPSTAHPSPPQPIVQTSSSSLRCSHIIHIPSVLRCTIGFVQPVTRRLESVPHFENRALAKEVYRLGLGRSPKMWESEFWVGVHPRVSPHLLILPTRSLTRSLLIVFSLHPFSHQDPNEETAHHP